MTLTKTEEQLMEYIWKGEAVFLKELLDAYPDPKPASTTLATLLKRMQDKGFVAYELMGNSRRYYALVNKEAYFSKQVNGLVERFFDNSDLAFASFFTKRGKLSTSELESLQKIIAEQLKKPKP